MVGTIDEVLLYITLEMGNAEVLEMSRQRLVGLRKHLKHGELSEEKKKDLISRWNTNAKQFRCAVCLREAFDLPAIVRDHKGRFFTEQSLLLMVEGEEKMRGLHLDKVCGAIRNGQFPNKETVREVLRRKGWTMFREREHVPSLWKVE